VCPGDFVIVGGRPSQGKSALLTQLMVNAVSAEVGVLFYSQEMSGKSLLERAVFSMARMDGTLARAGQIEEGEWERLADAHGKLHIADLWIRDLPATETEIIASAKRALLRHKIGLVIVDYLQLVICSRRCENRNLEIQHITRTFQRLARETGLPVVVAAQLSRAGEKRSDPKPRMSDLRESGAQEQDVDKLILIHNPNYRRPEQYDGASLARCKALVIVEKHRNGPTGEVQIWFTPAATRFDECTDQAWVEPAQPRAARREDW
jgi:replicative DNA helicase